MPTYRMYRLDGDGRIAGAEWVEAAGDAAAVQVARQRSGGGRVELWEGQRLVERIQAIIPPAGRPA